MIANGHRVTSGHFRCNLALTGDRFEQSFQSRITVTFRSDFPDPAGQLQGQSRPPVTTAVA